MVKRWVINCRRGVRYYQQERILFFVIGWVFAAFQIGWWIGVWMYALVARYIREGLPINAPYTVDLAAIPVSLIVASVVFSTWRLFLTFYRRGNELGDKDAYIITRALHKEFYRERLDTAVVQALRTQRYKQ